MATKTDYPVTLFWEIMPNSGRWDEICAWTIEHLGLPGHRYHTKITEDEMTWYFEDERDQLMFIVAWGNHER